MADGLLRNLLLETGTRPCETDGMSRNASFGARLRQLREAAALTQEELAARAGLTVKAVGALERGERRWPYPHTVRSLADALRLDSDGRAALVAAAQRPAAVARPTSAGVPVPPTPMVGRQAQLDEVLELVRSGVRGWSR